MEFEIYYSDLTEECQKRLNEFYNIPVGEDIKSWLSLDVMPVCVLEKEEEE